MQFFRAYDALQRVARITQSAGGGNAVAPKRVDFMYDDGSQFDTITRYADAGGTQLVAASAYGFDLAGRLTSLAHAKGQTALAGYEWTFDAGNRMTGFASDADGTAAYTHDPASQLTAADYTYQPAVPDEAYTYDANGNRVNGYTVGVNNRMTSDGTYRYLYDAEGNRTARFLDADQSGTITAGDTDITTYQWDHRNRLSAVRRYPDFAAYDQDTPDHVVEHSYDYRNRWVRRVVDPDGATGSAPVEQTIFAHDDRQILLQFGKTGSADLAASDLRHRYLWGPMVDQILADEQMSPLPPGEGQGEGYDLSAPGPVLWPLTDHLGTVRDLAAYDAGLAETTIANHRIYHAFGAIVDETAPTVAHLFAFTGRPLDLDTGLQNNLHRWYDSAVGRWLSEDPVGFEAEDANLYRYCQNGPLVATDPTGLITDNLRDNLDPSGEYCLSRRCPSGCYLANHTQEGHPHCRPYLAPGTDKFNKGYCMGACAGCNRRFSDVFPCQWCCDFCAKRFGGGGEKGCYVLCAAATTP